MRAATKDFFSKKMSSSSTAVVIVFVVLCFFIVVLKAAYDYSRFTNTYEKIMQDYNVGSIRAKLLDIAKAGSTVAAVAVASTVGGGGGGESASSSSPQNSALTAHQNVTVADKKRKSIAWVGGGGGENDKEEEKKGANNCLFDATVKACNLVDPKTGKPCNSQILREKCDEILKEEGLPLIPHGEPAGEQYLQALSRILNKRIKVYKGNRTNFVAEIGHSDVPEDADHFSIVHLGSQLAGHWVAC